MKEYNVNSLLFNNQVIKIKDADGGIAKEITFRKLSAGRTFEIGEKYNSVMTESQELKDDEKNFKKTKKMFSKVLDICFDIVRPLTLKDRIKNRFSKNYISKKWLMDNFDMDGLQQFIEMVIEPIAGGGDGKKA